MKRNFPFTGYVCPKDRRSKKVTQNGYTEIKLTTSKVFVTVLVLILSTFTLQAQRVTSNLQALYDFSEGTGQTVSSSAGVGPDLIIEDLSKVNWIPNGSGVNVTSSTIIQSSGNTAALKQALQSTNEITVELWIQPQNTSQNGSARIFTLSNGTYDRNFTISQGRNDNGKLYSARLRTSDTNDNGSYLEPTTPNNTASSSSIQHVVFTHANDGTEKIYVNGILEGSDTRTGDFSNWDNYELAFANEIGKDKTWLGKIYLGAIYNRDLTFNEVVQNYNEGLSYGSVGSANLALQPDENFSFGHDEGQTVDLYGSGVDCNNSPNVKISIPNSENVYQVVVEIIYKGDDPGSKVFITADGEEYVLQQAPLTELNSNVKVYRGLIPNSSIANIEHNAATNNCGNNKGLQSVAVYAFRNVEKNSEISTVFTEGSGYCDIVEFKIPINRNANARDVIVTLPFSDLTLDGRYLKIYANAGGKTSSTIIYASDENSSFGAPSITIENVPGNIDEVKIEVQTDKSNHPFLWTCGQSWVMAGMAIVEVVCPNLGTADIEVRNTNIDNRL